jgi:hypothetical protein
MFARDIDFAFFYDFSSTSSNYYDGAVPFCCSFYYLSILQRRNCIYHFLYQ